MCEVKIKKPCSCNNDTTYKPEVNYWKENILARMQRHVQESLKIRKEIADIIIDAPVDNITEIVNFIRTASFDKLHDFVVDLPNFKTIGDLKKDDFFYNPDGGELLQVISVKPYEDGTNLCTVQAIHYDNELTKYLFNLDRKVIVTNC